MFDSIIILATTSNEMSIWSFLIWVGILALIFFARNWIGRTIFGITFGICMLFFTIFLIDNYTGHNIRNFIDISFYDKTLEDPKGVANNLAGQVVEGGKDLSDKINDKGNDLDNSLGIKKDSETGKVWEEIETEESIVEESKEPEQVEEEEQAVLNEENSFIITYSEINNVLENDLNFLSKEDKALIKTMSPTLKGEFEGTNILVSNKEKELFENNKLKIVIFI